VVTHHAVQPAEFTTFFRSVHVSGQMQMIETLEEKRHALTMLANKYSPGLEESAGEYINEAAEHTAVFVLEIKTLTGKQNPPE